MRMAYHAIIIIITVYFLSESLMSERVEDRTDSSEAAKTNR